MNQKIEMPTIIEGGLAIDDRGHVSFVNDFSFSGVKRFYTVDNHQANFVRAWHGHWKEVKWVFVVSGIAIIRCVKMDHDEKQNRNNTPLNFVLSCKQPKILRIPNGFANGFMTLQKNTKIMFFSNSTLQESLDDDFRFPADHWGNWDIEQR